MILDGLACDHCLILRGPTFALPNFRSVDSWGVAKIEIEDRKSGTTNHTNDTKKKGDLFLFVVFPTLDPQFSIFVTQSSYFPCLSAKPIKKLNMMRAAQRLL
jgi:hypothetical protein